MGHQPSPPEFEGLEKRAEEEIGNLLISPFLTPGFEYLSTALPLAGVKTFVVIRPNDCAYVSNNTREVGCRRTAVTG